MPRKKNTVPITIRAKANIKADAGSGGKIPAVSMTAYTGRELFIDGFDGLPVVVSLDGLTWNTTTPLQTDHEDGTKGTIGQLEAVWIEGTNVLATGRITAETDAARHVVGMAKKGHEWQASIGAAALEHEVIPAGRSVEVNGYTFEGPIVVAWAARLREVSIVSVGGDLSTEVVITAKAGKKAAAKAAKIKGQAMPTFEDWAAEQGYDLATMSAEDIEALKAKYEEAKAAGTVEAGGNPDDEEITAEGGDPEEDELKAEEVETSGGGLTFETWVASMGFDVEKLSDQQKAAMQREFATSYGGTTTAQARARLDIKAGGGRRQQASQSGKAIKASGQSPVKILRAQMAAETKRIAAINQKLAKYPTIAAKAVANGWSINKAELVMLRAQANSSSPAIHIRSDQSNSPKILEAAFCKAGGMRGLEKQFDAPTLEATHRHYRDGLGIHELLVNAAAKNGHHQRDYRVTSNNIKPILKAAFSTAVIGDLLSNVANKFALEAFMYEEQAWRKVATIGQSKDYKEKKSVRLKTKGFEKVGRDGKLKHGELSDEAFGNQVELSGIIYVIPMPDIVNDDMGSISSVPKQIGRDGNLALNLAFWGEYMNNATFFTTERGNYDEGADTVLSIDSLGMAVEMLMLLGDNGHPLGRVGKYLVVPPALAARAYGLYKSTNLIVGGGSSAAQAPDGNIYAGQFEPVVSAYLQNQSLTGNSAKKWYLQTDPTQVNTCEVAFLNGQETPVVESAEADFDTLGIQMRSHYSFGVRKQDHRGAVAEKGEN